MTDYSADPVAWEPDGAIAQLDELPLSEETKTQLREWADWYEAGGVPGRKHHWSSPEDLDRFDREGRRLWKLVRDELGSEWTVGYFSEPTGERLWPSND